MDAVLAAVVFGALAVQSVAVAVSWGGGYWWFDAVVGAVVGVLALLRRRHRLLAAVGGLSVAAVSVLIAWLAGFPAEPGLAMAVALAVLTASAVRALPVRSAGAVAAAGLAVVVGSALANLESSSAVGAVNAVTWLGGLAGGLVLRLLEVRRRRTVARIRRDERLALARELHDVVAHHITGIVLEAQAGQLDARTQSGGERVRASFAGIESVACEALAAMRRVVGLLRDTDGAAPTTVAGPEELVGLVERFAKRGGPSVDLRLAETGQGWPPEVATTVHRVVQEALTNVARHAAHASSVTVSLTRDGDVVVVEVTDDAAHTRHRRGGYGLVGMRERVEALGGSLSVGPCPGAGWRVRALLPLGERR